MVENVFPQMLRGTGNTPVRLWAHEYEIEHAAQQQLRNTAMLPWTTGVAVMPDVHMGYGATVGSVIAMKDAVSPSAVGVDIGCFTGDTKVILANNKKYTLKSLVDRYDPFVVWSASEEGLVSAAYATAKMTRENSALVMVTIDNGEQVRCTPDHEFMLSNGSFKRADLLDAGETLMSLYENKSRIIDYKVVSVVSLEEKEDVYCLTVPETGNFALAAGIFVHNCGMAAVKTSLTASVLPEDLHDLRLRIESAIPVGFKKHDNPVNMKRFLGAKTAGLESWWKNFSQLHEGVQDRESTAIKQLGTLGGGNHFIEVCLDDNNDVWLMLHSGSRNIGKELAERHITIAKSLPHNQDIPSQARDLAVFLNDTKEMDAYRHDLYWAQEYALYNRSIMMALLKNVVQDSFPGVGVSFGEEISCHHNYVAEEEWDGERLLITRKGAIRAARGELGIIPGSMGTGSYIVRGLDNPAAYGSASHGAGRKMSRSAAKKQYTVDDVVKQTRGVESRKDKSIVDEIPAAYKDIDEVIRAQSNLVEVAYRLKQIICVKG